MSRNRATPELTSDLDYWEIILRTGERVTLRAHAYKEIEDAYVFVALMEGDPAYEYELLRFPAAIVEDVDGGGPSPPSDQ